MQAANVVDQEQKPPKVKPLNFIRLHILRSIFYPFKGDGQKMVKKEGENNVAEAGENISIATMETEAK